MFSTLDLCYLMCRGQIAFTGRPAEAEGFLLSAGLPCPQGTPAAEHLLTVASEPSLRDCLLEFAQQAAQVCPASLVLLKCQYLGAQLSARVFTAPTCISNPKTFAAELSVLQDKGDGSELAKMAIPSRALSRRRGQQRIGLTTELAVLSWRTLVDIWRNPGLLLLHIGIGLVMGVLVGAIFLNLTNDVAGAQGRLGTPASAPPPAHIQTSASPDRMFWNEGRGRFSLFRAQVSVCAVTSRPTGCPEMTMQAWCSSRCAWLP